MEDFSLCWNQCVFTPGINLVALTILIGCKLGGISGMFASLIGMMVPSSLITLFLTIGFSFIARLSATQTVLKGVIPATAGFLLVVGFSFAQPTLKSAYKKNIWHFSASIAIVIASIIAINVFQIAIMIVLPAAAIIGMLIFTPWKISKKPTPLPEAEKETVEN